MEHHEYKVLDVEEISDRPVHRASTSDSDTVSENVHFILLQRLIRKERRKRIARRSVLISMATIAGILLIFHVFFGIAFCNGNAAILDLPKNSCVVYSKRSSSYKMGDLLIIRKEGSLADSDHEMDELDQQQVVMKRILTENEKLDSEDKMEGKVLFYFSR